MKRLTLLYFSFLFLLFTPALAWSAACCGGGFASPAIISGDDKAQLTSSYSFTEVRVDNVDSQGIWHSWDSHQQVQSIRIEGAHVFEDRWQAGFALPFISRNKEASSYSGLGDLSASLGYEYLPDWDYNPWRPKGIGFLQLTLPTGKSRADSEFGGLDSRGNGFWAIGAGTLLTKSWIQFDAFVLAEVHRSFSKSFSTSQVSGDLNPGVGGNLGCGFGYNLKDYRFGTGITWTYEDAIEMKTASSSAPGSVERYATAQANVSYMANDDWSGTLSLTDQTLFGSPVNTSLGKGVAVQLQRRWGR